MLYFDKIDNSEGIDVNKASSSRECIICNSWYFLDKSFRFHPTICNCCCHDSLMMSVNLKTLLL